MEKINTGKGSISMWGIIVALAGAITVLGFFLALTKLTDMGIGITGWDMLRGQIEGEDYSDEYTFWRFIPFITMLVGIATVVMEVLPAVGVDKPALKLVAMILGIVTLVLGIMVLAFSAGTACFEHGDDLKFHRAIGAYFMLYGGLFASVFGFLDYKGIGL